MDSEENATLCSVCREIYSDPRCLACGHSFCFKCLKRVARNKNTFPCPICRFDVNLRYTSVDQLPKNFVLCNVIEAREKKHPSMCLDHNKVFDLFCQRCDVVICSKCLTMLHKGHDVADLETIFSQRFKQYGAFLESTKHLVSMIEEKKDAVKQLRMSMEKNIDSISNTVDNTFKKWNDALQKQHNAICSYLHQQRERKRQVFFEAERILAVSMTTVTGLDTEINKLRNKGTVLAVQQYGSIKARQEATECKILQDIETCFMPPDMLVIEVYAPWIEEAIKNIKHIDMKQKQAKPGRQTIAEIQEENVILKRECEKLRYTLQELKKSSKSELENETKNVLTLTQELDNLRDQTHRLEDEVKTLRFRQTTSQSDTDLKLKGAAIAQTKETSNSDAVDNVTTFFEQLVSALHDLLKHNITDASKAYLSSLPAASDKKLEKKLKDMHAKVEETTKLCMDKNRDVELASRLFADLSKLAKATSTDSDSEDRSNDRSAEKKGVLGRGNGGAIVPSQIDRSPKFQLDFELVKTALIQKKDSQRLSELAGAKLYKDNPNIVDLSDPNRSTKLKDKYCEIYSNEWMDAYQKLSESKPKRSKANIIKFLLDILLEGFTYCTQIRDIQRVGLLDVILYPMGDYGNRQVKKENVEINDILARHLAEVPKLSGDMTGERVAKAFFGKKDMREKFGPDFETSETYIIQCVKLCWLMQVQTPPVCLDLAAKPGDKFDNETYKEYTKKGKKIDFIVWPPLRRNEGGDLIEKGVAQGK